jgi:histidinol-phosphatase
MMPGLAARHDLAVEAARAAGILAKHYFDSAFEVEWKADESPVTVADRAAELLIRELVAKHFPGDGFLGEEFGDQPGSTGYRWIMDPIDGTRAFVRRLPFWGTLIGLEFENDPVVGAVYVPCMNLLYHAGRGRGAYRDQSRIRVSDVRSLDKSFLCYSSIGWFQRAGKAELFLELAAKTERQRGYGDFFGYIHVADGGMELMIDHGVHAWDVAAVVPIVEEAGGKFTNWAGERTIHSPDVFASNGHLHAAGLAILQS